MTDQMKVWMAARLAETQDSGRYVIDLDFNVSVEQPSGDHTVVVTDSCSSTERLLDCIMMELRNQVEPQIETLLFHDGLSGLVGKVERA